MAKRYGHLKPDAMHTEMKTHFETQPKLFKQQDAHELATQSAADYKNGHDLVEHVKSVLQELGSKEQDSAKKAKIDLAINSLHDATTAFGNACLVFNASWDISDS